MKGIGGLIIVGLILWAISKAEPVKAAEAEKVTAIEPSLYELLHTTVPITEYREVEIPTFETIEQYNEAMGVG